MPRPTIIQHDSRSNVASEGKFLSNIDSVIVNAVLRIPTSKTNNQPLIPHNRKTAENGSIQADHLIFISFRMAWRNRRGKLNKQITHLVQLAAPARTFCVHALTPVVLVFSPGSTKSNLRLTGCSFLPVSVPARCNIPPFLHFLCFLRGLYLSRNARSV